MGTTRCNGGNQQSAADPALAWAPDGYSYFLFIAGNPDAGEPVTRLVLYRLDPRGRHYTGPIFIPARVGFKDRPTITVDPSDPRRLGATWTFRHRKPRLDALDDIVLATSNNRGQRWSERKIYTGGPNEFIWGLQLFYTGRRDRLITYRSEDGSSWRFYALRSHDGGRTWSAPKLIGSIPRVYPVSAGKAMPSGGDLASQGPDGSIDIVWSENTPDGHGRVLLARTSDAGRSWSHPRVVAKLRCDAFLPAVAVSSRGTTGISYYAFRQCDGGQQGPQIDARFAASSDGGRHWQHALLSGPFDVQNVITPEHGGHPFPAYFLGDYTGLTAPGADFAAALILPKPYAHSGEQDVFFRRIKAH